MIFFFFFFNDPPTTEIYTLSLHDALPILRASNALLRSKRYAVPWTSLVPDLSPRLTIAPGFQPRSEEHTSELQSLRHLVCRLLLEKKNNITITTTKAELIFVQQKLTTTDL